MKIYKEIDKSDIEFILGSKLEEEEEYDQYTETEHEKICKRLLFRNDFIHSSIMFKLKPFIESGGYNSFFKGPATQTYRIVDDISVHLNQGTSKNIFNWNIFCSYWFNPISFPGLIV